MTTEPKNTPGRPPVPEDLQRSARLSVNLRQADYDQLQKIGKDAGFRSGSQMASAILESLLEGGFNPPRGFRICSQIIQRVEKNNPGSARFCFRTLFQSPPALLPPEPLYMEDVADDLRELQSIIKTKEA